MIVDLMFMLSILLCIVALILTPELLKTTAQAFVMMIESCISVFRVNTNERDD